MSVGVALLVALAGETARAAGSTSALSWVRLGGAEGCIPVSELSTRVERRLRRPAFVSPSVAEVAIEGHVEAKASHAGFHAVLRGTRRDGSEIGVRELDAKGGDCRLMDDDLVLVIALLIDPDATSGEGLTPLSTVSISPSERVAVPLSSDTELGVRSAFGLFPDAAAGLTVEARVALGRLDLGIGLFSTLGREQDNPGPVRYAVTEGEVSLGRRWSLPRRFELAAVAGAHAGVMSVEAAGSSSGSSAKSLPLIDLEAGPRFLGRVAGPLFVEASGSLIVPLLRQQPEAEVGAETPTALWRRPAVGGELGLSLGLRFVP